MKPCLSLVIVIVLRCNGGQASEDTSGNYTERKDEGQKETESFICHGGGPRAQLPLDCSSEKGNALVINGMDLAFTGTCQRNTEDTLYSVPCLTMLDRGAALRSLERAVLEGCSGRPNCSVAQVPPLQLPGLASSVGYLKVISSCVPASPANTVEFCSDSSLRGDKVFLHYSPDTARQAVDGWQCRCQAKGEGGLSLQALAVWQREAGSSVTVLSGTGPYQRERVWPPSTTLHGEERQVFPGPDLSVTVGPLHRSRPAVVWLQLSGNSIEVEVTCNAPEPIAKHTVSAVIWVIIAFFILGACCAIVYRCIRIRRRRQEGRRSPPQQGDEIVAVYEARPDQEDTAPAEEEQPPPASSDVVRLLSPEPDARAPS